MIRGSKRKAPIIQHSSPSAKLSSNPLEGAEVSELADIKVRLLAGHNFKRNIKHLDAEKHPRAIRLLRWRVPKGGSTGCFKVRDTNYVAQRHPPDGPSAK